MQSVDLTIRKDGNYYWITSESVKGLVIGGTDLSKVLAQAPDVINTLIDANNLEPLQDYDKGAMTEDKEPRDESELLSDVSKLIEKWIEIMERNRQHEKQHQSEAAGIMAGAQAGQILDLITLLEKHHR